MAADLGLPRNGRGRSAAAQSWPRSRQFTPVAKLEPGQRISRYPRPIGPRARRSSERAGAQEGRTRVSETLEPALPDHLDEQAERLMRRLCDRGFTIATAESCTGGMLAALLTDIEGAGRGFERGFVTYTKEAKSELLGIEPSVLDQNEAVSEVVARAMAEGALRRSHADFAIGVTGFAGPAGTGCEEGLVHIALAQSGRQTEHRVEHFGARGRGIIRVQSLKAMLEMLEQALEQA